MSIFQYITYYIPLIVCILIFQIYFVQTFTTYVLNLFFFTLLIDLYEILLIKALNYHFLVLILLFLRVGTSVYDVMDTNSYF